MRIRSGEDVSTRECQQAFCNGPLVIMEEQRRVPSERRFRLLGHTDAGRYLFIVYTVQRDLIRVLDAREMSHRERRRYDRARQTRKALHDRSPRQTRHEADLHPIARITAG